MIINPQKITLDFWRNDYKSITVKQSDTNSRQVLVTCTDDGEVVKLNPINHTCNVRMITPDGRNIYETATVNTDGTITVEFTDNMLAIGGNGKLELEVIEALTGDDGAVVSTMHLAVNIVSRVYPDDAIIASDEFNALNEALTAIGTFESLESIEQAAEIINNHADVVATTEVASHVKPDGVTIGIDANGVISVIGTDNEDTEVVVPDGVVYVDFTDSEETEVEVVEQLNGVSLYTEGDKLKASWINEGVTVEAQLSPINEDISTDNLVPTTRTIAGIDLTDNVTKEELRNALEIYDGAITGAKWGIACLSTDVKTATPIGYVIPFDKCDDGSNITFDAENHGFILKAGRTYELEATIRFINSAGYKYFRFYDNVNKIMRGISAGCEVATANQYANSITPAKLIVTPEVDTLYNIVVDTASTTTEIATFIMTSYFMVAELKINNAELDDVISRLEALENIDIAEGGAY